MSVAANQLMARQEGCRGSYPVAASTHIYQATLVFVNGSGYASDSTATGANRFGGVAIGEVDNSSGAAGDLKVEVAREGIFELTGSGFTQADVGKVAFGTDNFTVSTSYAAGAVRIGRVVEYVSATKLRVDIDVLGEGGGMAYTAVAASTAVSNTTTETAFDNAYTIKANTLRAGDVIRVVAQSIATATNSTDTLNVKLRLGSTAVIATGAVDVSNNDIQVITADIVIRTAGASGTFVAAGASCNGASGTGTMKAGYLGSTAVDTTADISVNCSATWSNASASNSARLDVLDVQILRKN